MAVELARSITITQRNGIRPYAINSKPNLRLIDTGKAIASKIAFETSMQKAQLNQAYWDELLEKLRKFGGGGGGGSSFDKIATSMRFMNFLSDKTIQAMLRNFTSNFTKAFDGMINNSQIQNQNVIISIVQSIGKSMIGILNVGRNLPWQISTVAVMKSISNLIPALAQILSFQLNKLKEILEESLKEFIRKLDVRGKMRKVKTIFSDFFIEMKKEVANILEWINSAALLHIESVLKNNLS